MSNEGQIPVDDRINTDYIRKKLDRVYDEVQGLCYSDLLTLCSFLIVVHNHWNWENLLKELLPNNKTKGVDHE